MDASTEHFQDLLGKLKALEASSNPNESRLATQRIREILSRHPLLCGATGEAHPFDGRAGWHVSPSLRARLTAMQDAKWEGEFLQAAELAMARRAIRPDSKALVFWRWRDLPLRGRLREGSGVELDLDPAACPNCGHQWPKLSWPKGTDPLAQIRVRCPECGRQDRI